MKRIAPNLAKLINLLNDCDFHAGSELGEILNITRSAVWKYIKQLQQYGITLEAIKGKGYRFNHPIHLLNKSAIEDALSEPLLKQALTIDVFASVNSTSEYLKTKLPHGGYYACLSEEQTAGRGRLSRSWHSPFGCNIYCSLLCQMQTDISQLSGLSLVISCALIKALQQLDLPQQGFSLKWPNDILWQNKKLGGCVIDLMGESHGKITAIIGMGLNINSDAQTIDSIDRPWTSLKQITGKQFDRNRLAALILDSVYHYIQQYNEHGFDAIKQQWQQYDYLYQQPVSLEQHQTIISGTAVGINHQGHLGIRDEHGNTRYYTAGDVSLHNHFSTAGENSPL